MGLIVPTFFGYYNTHRALLAGQVALNTINQNISNVNTPGYSRQRVDLTASDPYPPMTISNYGQGGQIGQGVTIQGISRSHDNFLDGQIRTQTSQLGFQSQVRDTLQQAEGVLGEPSGSGIDASMTDFFAAAQNLSLHPEDIASRTSFIQSARNMIDVFQQQATQLKDLRTNLVGDASVPGSFNSSQAYLTVQEINSSLSQVADLNAQIQNVEAGGATPNDLLDKRDQLLGDLSKQLNITVEYKASDQVSVKLGSDYLVQGKNLTDTLNAVQNPGPVPLPDDTPTLVQLTNAGTDVTNNITGGTLGGILAVGGNDPNKMTIRGVLGGMDTLFNQIATQINTLQASGRDLNGNIPAPPDDQIFTLAVGPGLSIFNYSMNNDFVQDPKLVAAANDDAGAFDGVGDGRNALAMAQVSSQVIAGLGNTSIHEYFNAQIAKLGVSSKAAQDASTNIDNAVQQLDQRRQSIQGVNMEEEMVDLLRYQRGFEASAKVLTTLDDTVNTIINKMI